VHAFALDPERGMWILAIMTILAGGGLTLFALRSHLLGHGQGFALSSREAFIGINNLLLTVVTGIVLIGTVYPLIAAAFGASGVSIGAAYYNFVATKFLAALLIFLPLAPFLPWRKAGLNRALAVRASLWILPGIAGGLWAVWLGGSPIAIAAAALAGWTLAGLAADVWAHRSLATRGARLGLAGRVFAHAGIAAIALGAVADSTGAPETTAALAPGESVQVADYTLTLQGVTRADGPNYLADEARLQVQPAGELRPQRRFYTAAETTTREVAIQSRLSGDLYVSLGEPRTRESGEIAYEIRVSFNPLVWLLGLGATLIVIGGMLATVSRWISRRAVETAA
jgi:cytochrome c-type biogenesis protein CcmF